MFIANSGEKKENNQAVEISRFFDELIKGSKPPKRIFLLLCQDIANKENDVDNLKKAFGLALCVALQAQKSSLYYTTDLGRKFKELINHKDYANVKAMLFGNKNNNVRYRDLREFAYNQYEEEPDLNKKEELENYFSSANAKRMLLYEQQIYLLDHAINAKLEKKEQQAIKETRHASPFQGIITLLDKFAASIIEQQNKLSKLIEHKDVSDDILVNQALLLMKELEKSDQMLSTINRKIIYEQSMGINVYHLETRYQELVKESNPISLQINTFLLNIFDKQLSSCIEKLVPVEDKIGGEKDAAKITANQQNLSELVSNITNLKTIIKSNNDSTNLDAKLKQAELLIEQMNERLEKLQFEKKRDDFQDKYMRVKEKILLRVNKKIELQYNQLPEKELNEFKLYALEMVENLFKKYLDLNAEAKNMEMVEKNHDEFSENLDKETVDIFANLRRAYKERFDKVGIPKKVDENKLQQEDDKSKEQSIFDETFAELKPVERPYTIEGGLLPEEQAVKVILQTGAIKHADQTTAFDTTKGFSHMKAGYMSYVLKKDGLYLFNHFDIDMISHATFGCGGVYSAGEMQIDKDGKLKMITAYSGHYRPNEINVFNTIAYLQRYKLIESDTVVKLFSLNAEYKLKPTEEVDVKSTASFGPESTNESMVSYRAEDLYKRVLPINEPMQRLLKIKNNIFDPESIGNQFVNEVAEMKIVVLKAKSKEDLLSVGKQLDVLEDKVNKHKIENSLHARLESLRNMIYNHENTADRILNKLSELKESIKPECNEKLLNHIKLQLDFLEEEIKTYNRSTKISLFGERMVYIKQNLLDTLSENKNLNADCEKIFKEIGESSLNTELIASFNSRLDEMVSNVNEAIKQQFIAQIKYIKEKIPDPSGRDKNLNNDCEQFSFEIAESSLNTGLIASFNSRIKDMFSKVKEAYETKQADDSKQVTPSRSRFDSLESIEAKQAHRLSKTQPAPTSSMNVVSADPPNASPEPATEPATEPEPVTRVRLGSRSV